MIIKLKTTNDKNGNPRKEWGKQDGYESIVITPTEYNNIKRLYLRD